MKKQMIIVSACLAGIYCRYNGETVSFEPVVELVRQGKAIPFCPEAYGGLPTPRPPCEILDGRIIDTEGADLTEQFHRGAEEGLRLAQMVGCKEAILKAYSPSCGSETIYDGTFSSTRVSGDGVFAKILKDNGISVRTDEDFE